MEEKFHQYFFGINLPNVLDRVYNIIRCTNEIAPKKNVYSFVEWATQRTKKNTEVT